MTAKEVHLESEEFTAVFIGPLLVPRKFSAKSRLSVELDSLFLATALVTGAVSSHASTLSSEITRAVWSPRPLSGTCLLQIQERRQVSLGEHNAPARKRNVNLLNWQQRILCSAKYTSVLYCDRGGLDHAAFTVNEVAGPSSQLDMLICDLGSYSLQFVSLDRLVGANAVLCQDLNDFYRYSCCMRQA
ncbi:hypothetical protein BGAL_0685g00060 [Botrytis galanthina]|uniref:Uncharacterized protein n=1 Tax=Botrytis galanthina TaxID=278940 RepID=A0A4S8QHU4_9HELO|nr:hypothetical protein BGAL_0685g00060 [Botrytis galanthina]